MSRALEEADAVSVELMGTLLVSAVCRPVDVYRLTQELFNHRSGRYLTDELAPHRFTAESGRRHEAQLSGRSPDSVTLAAIYERVGESMMLDPSMTALLIEAELEAMRWTLRVDPTVAQLVRSATEAGKRAVGVADTCLPSLVFEEVLVREGLSVQLVLSCETGWSMTGDAAWHHLSGRFSGRKLVHLGSDPAVASAAARHGVTPQHITGPVELYRSRLGPANALDGPRVFQHLEIDGFRLNNVHRSVINALVARWLAGDQAPSAATAIGYGAFGPCVTAFVQWIHRTAVRANCDGLVFEGRGGTFVADAYRRWWGESALPCSAADEGTGHPQAPAVVASGWNDATGRWDGWFPNRRSDTGGSQAVRLCAGLHPSSPSERGPAPCQAFVDGRTEAQRALFSDLFGTKRGLLEACLSGDARPGSEDPVGEVQEGALDFVADFRALTTGLPSTVAIIDRRTACENLVMVLNFPFPVAEQALDRVREAHGLYSSRDP